jgi:hypothetical protein
MEKKVREMYSQYDAKRKAFDAQQADKEDLKALEEFEQKIKQQ